MMPIPDSLSAFFAHNADADVRFLYHGNVVGAIANGGANRTSGEILDHGHDFRLLQWGEAARQHGRRRAANVGEGRPQPPFQHVACGMKKALKSSRHHGNGGL